MRNDYCSIYLLTNQIDGKIYVGQTWNDYICRMGSNGASYKGCIHLYAAIQKYGYQNFKYTTLATALSQKEADKLEEHYIKLYNSCDHSIGYNIKRGGAPGQMAEETKLKISIANKKAYTSEESRQKLRGKHSPERIEKRRQSLMEPQEVQDQVIAAYKSGKTIKEIKVMFDIGGNGKVYRILDNNGIARLNNFSKWTGKIHTDQTKNKMSEARSKYWNDKK